ncbi:hypothetical protein KW790_02670 [Candidatus Parcubacteria bacterium]|nr:hypothetical protein [Candidatus Parcubacteria bacterium]
MPRNIRTSSVISKVPNFYNLSKLRTPAQIQDFLNKLKFNFEKSGETLKSPKKVLETKSAHCLEGALLAASILWGNGHKPLLLDLKASRPDYDHVVALYKHRGMWGAISKTNHAVLRYREPVYKSIRELAMSYFHEYFLKDGTKTLKSFSKPFDLSKLGSDWIISKKDLFYISRALDKSLHERVVSHKVSFRKADLIEIKAGEIVES